MSNCLITSAGRRNTLLQKFCDAFHPNGGKVFAADMSSMAPALYQADGQIKVPAVRSDEYIPFLLETVKEHDISVLVPTIDTELPALSANRERFLEAGCTVLISSDKFCSVCADKLFTAREFAQRGVEVTLSWDGLDLPPHENLPEHLYIKPRDGSASVNVFKIRRAELESYVNRVPNPVVQEELIGDEVTVDAFIAPDGRVMHYVPRKRIRTLAGESIVGVTCDDASLDKWCEQTLAVCATMGACWVITLQAFCTGERIILTEINPRFGGGIPLAFAAGGDYANMAYDLVNGKDVDACLGAYKRGLYFMRYMTEVFTENPVW